MIYALAAWLLVGLIVRMFNDYREDPDDTGGILTVCAAAVLEVVLWPVAVGFRLAR